MKKIAAVLLIFIFGLLVYSLTLKGVPGNVTGSMIKNNLDQATKPLELSPERGRYIQIIAIAENHVFNLNKELAAAAYPDTGYYQGKLYVFFAPGISLMALPFYIVGKYFQLSQVFSFGMISIFASLNLVCIYLISKYVFKLPSWIALFSALIFGFASSSWSYAGTLYQHHVTTFLLLSGFLAVWNFRKQTKFRFLWAAYTWIAFAWGIWIDYPNALTLSPIIIYLAISTFTIIRSKTDIKISVRFVPIIASFGFVILMGVQLYYNYSNFGNIRRVNGSLVSYKLLLQNQKKDKNAVQAYDPGVVVHFFEENKMPAGFDTLFFSGDRGLFLYYPIFALGLLGIYKIRRKIGLESAILLAVIGCNIFLYSSWQDPWGGWAFGPRYLIPSLSILSIFVGMWLANVKLKLLSRVAAFVLFIYSSAVALVGALTTNQVPPQVEADYLHTKYNFLLNFDYLKDNRSSSFIYNQYISHFMNLTQFYILILTVLFVIAFIFLFVVPYLTKDES